MLIEVKDHGPYGGIGMSGRVNPVVRILFCEARRLRNQRLGGTALQRFGQEVPRTPGFSPCAPSSCGADTLVRVVLHEESKVRESQV